MSKIFAFISVLYVISMIFFCEFTVKTTEHIVASYESSDFTRKFLTVYAIQVLPPTITLTQNKIPIYHSNQINFELSFDSHDLHLHHFF
jgi:hypothetical protein